jgi:lauroyl/myristoyl acyltransferase
MALRIMPRRFRFAAALLLARVTIPLLRSTAAYREQWIKNFHRPHEIVLYLLLNALAKNGTRFDLDIAATGYQHFERAYAKGKGVLVTGHHAALTLLMIRYFYDRGFEPVVITPDDRLCVPGTCVVAETIQPSPMFLVQLRNALRAGKLVCAMPDRAEHHAGRTLEFTTPAGRVIMAPAIIEIAARSGAEVLFTEVRVEGRRLVARIVAPAAASAGITPGLIADFILFVRDCTSPTAAHALTSRTNTKSRDRFWSFVARRRCRLD